MSTRIQLSTKRKSTPNHYEIQESPRIEEGDYPTTSHEDEEEGTQTRSRDTQGRSATSASTILAQAMMANQKNPPPPAAAAATASTRSVTTTASLGTSSRARAVQSPQVQAASITTSQANQNVPILNYASPPAVAQMPVASLQAMQPPLPIQDAGQRQSPTAHSVAAIQAQGDFLDDASSLSATENGNIKAMRMLHQYFVSLAASATVRSIVEERNMITDKLGGKSSSLMQIQI